MCFVLQDKKGINFGDVLTAFITVKSPVAQAPVQQQPSMGMSMMDTLYFDIASQLCDKGYGDFEHCLDVVKQANGNVQEATEILSKEIFEKFQKQSIMP